MGVQHRRLLAHLAFAVLVIAATLNRSSSIVLVIAYILTVRDRWTPFYALLWSSTYGILIFSQPNSGPAITAGEVIARDLAQIPYILLVNLPYLILLVIAVLRWRYISRLEQQLFWLLPIYFFMLLGFGLLWETRLWIPVLPILLAIALKERS